MIFVLVDSNGVVESSIKNEDADFKKVQYAYGSAEKSELALYFMFIF